MSDRNHDTLTVTIFAVFGTVMSLLAVCALVGNVICFRWTRRLSATKPSMALVLNLNMCDIIVAATSWAAFMMQHIADQLDYSIHVIVHKIIWSIIVGLGNVTILNLVGLAADCFIALRWPLHYKEIATQRSITMFIIVVWVSSVIAGAGDFIVAASRTTADLSYADAVRETFILTRGNTEEKLRSSITMLLSNSLSFVSLLTMTTMYSYILYKIRSIRRSNSKLNKQAGGLKNEINAVRTTLFIFTSFLLLWLPTLAMNIISVIRPDFLSTLTHLQASLIGYTADTLLMLHSIVDALIYGRRVFKNIGRQRKSRRDNLEFSRAYTLRRTSSSGGLQKFQTSHENGITASTQQPAEYISADNSNGSSNNDRVIPGAITNTYPLYTNKSIEQQSHPDLNINGSLSESPEGNRNVEEDYYCVSYINIDVIAQTEETISIDMHTSERNGEVKSSSLSDTISDSDIIDTSAAEGSEEKAEEEEVAPRPRVYTLTVPTRHQLMNRPRCSSLKSPSRSASPNRVRFDLTHERNKGKKRKEIADSVKDNTPQVMCDNLAALSLTINDSSEMCVVVDQQVQRVKNQGGVIDTPVYQRDDDERGHRSESTIWTTHCTCQCNDNQSDTAKREVQCTKL